MYNYRILHVPGKSQAMATADAQSRNPTEDPLNTKETDGLENAARSFAIHQAEHIKSTSWSDIRDAAIQDEECVALVKLIEQGFPEKRNQLPANLRRYWSMKDELYTIEGVPFKDNKMLIPSSLRRVVLEGLHSAHQGVQGMLANARQRFFWPGLDSCVRLTREQCRQCNENFPSQPAEPLIETPQPERPFKQAVTDIFHLAGHDFLVYADRYSGWAEVERVIGTSFHHIREVFLRWFMTYGVPEEIAYDGGPPFNSSEFVTFREIWNIRKRLSSAYYPQSNGRAELAVKSMKRALTGHINPTSGKLNTDAAARAIMTYRNTPNETGMSPAQLLKPKTVGRYCFCFLQIEFHFTFHQTCLKISGILLSVQLWWKSANFTVVSLISVLEENPIGQ